MKWFLGVAAALAAAVAPAGDGPLDARRMIWAHYVPWTTPENNSLTPAGYVNHPATDITDDPLRDEIRRAKAQGIDGFLMDVCLRPGATTFADIRKFLRAAEGTDFYCAVCLDRKTDVANQVAEVKKLMALNAGHANYPKIGGRPLVATYTWHDWTPQEWRQIRAGLAREGVPVYLVANLGLGQKRYDTELLAEYADIFDAGYYFGYGARGPSVARKNGIAAGICAERGRLFMPALAPGYFGGWVRGRNDFYQPFRGIDVIQDKFESARSLSGVKWLHVTTWNDYDETALAPCRLTPGCFPLVRAYADEWKRLPPPPRADVIFAYHREEFAGTMIRFEAMRLPSADTGRVIVGGRLRDKDGAVVARLEPKTLAGPAWERVEWLVPSAELAVSPVLVPEVAMRGAAGPRRAVLPPVFLVRGWLECPETIRVAFGNCVDVDGSLAVTYERGVLTATASFSAPVAVKRAILYRNDRPLGQFAPDEADGLVQTSVAVRGKGNWRVTVENGRVAEALRSFCPKSADGNFRMTGTSVVGYRTPDWARTTFRAVGAPDMRFILTANKVRRELTPADFAAARRIDAGGFSFALSPDLTLYERRPWKAGSGTAALSFVDRPPQPSDVFWVRFETADGRAGATSPVWPFAPREHTAEAALIETCVTLEHSSGGSGRPGDREFLTPPEAWPVKETRLVRRPATRLSVRRAFWPMGGRDGKDVRGAEMNAYGDRALAGRRLPLRMWPSGPATVAVDVFPEPFDGTRQVILRRHGWMDGIASVSLAADGRIEATYGDHNVALTVKGTRPLRAKRWTRVSVVFDGLRLKIFQDGRADGEGALAASVRCYGNCTAFIGGKTGTDAFRGRLANLELVGECPE